MSKSLRIVAICFISVVALLVLEVVYLSFFSFNEKKHIQEKQSFVAFVGIPDLAISKEPYIRHRSLSATFDVYSIDGALREYEKESFLISKGLR